MKKGGCAIYDRFPGQAVCRRLLEESRQRVAGAIYNAVAVSDEEEIRGGSPARRFISAGGGDEQATFYRDPETARFLSCLCNSPVHPTGECGTYTYYARAGDHLALHRDVQTCDVAVVTCLLDRHVAGSLGGATRYYPARHHEPLSSIRQTPNKGAVTIRLPVMTTMIMLGGLVPHLIEPMAEAELRIVSILCFRACDL